MKTLSLYLHLPYCPVRCPYCDFYTLPRRHPVAPERYFRGVCRELRAPDAFGWSERELSSVFLGGGTPSLHSGDELGPAFETIRSRFSVARDTEITIETNPETVTRRRAEEWRRLGINRASLGVQSLDDRELAWLGRAHTSARARKAFDELREAGFENVSLDLVFGLESQTVDGWSETLARAAAWRPDHVSAYNLTIEERTRFGSLRKLGRLSLPSEEIQSEMYLRARSLLADAGLPPYEISNYATPGFASRHNLAYWTGGNYWGVGASAHSFQRRRHTIRRFWNPKSARSYLDSLESGKPPTEEEETLTARQHFGERLMTGLRLAAGVDLDELSRDLACDPGESFRGALARHINDGHLELEGGRIRLTPRGILLSNEIFPHFL